MPLSRRAAVAVAFVNLFPRLAQASNPRHYRYRWDTRRRIVIENKLGPAWNEAVQVQAAAWRAAYPRFRFTVMHRPGPCRTRKRGIVICHGNPDSPYPGLARISNRGREIRRVRIELLEGYVPGPNMALLCHELAHALGLKHNQAGPESCVGGTTLTAELPGSYDRQSLRMLYGRKGSKWP